MGRWGGETILVIGTANLKKPLSVTAWVYELVSYIKLRAAPPLPKGEA